MNRLHRNITLPLAAGMTLLAGCASKASMDARYESSLQHWRGASRADLEAGWGKPRLAQITPEGEVLTWTVRADADIPRGSGAAPLYATSTTAGMSPGPSVTTATPAMPTSVTVPATCTTHFTIKDGRVASWTFEGLGCGAPG